MPRAPYRPDELRNKIFFAPTVIQQGLLTKDDLRSSAWKALFRGVYADSRLTVTHLLRCRAVARYLLPAGSTIAGRSAAHLYGVPFLASDAPVEVVVPTRFGPRQGILAHHDLVDSQDVRSLQQINLTTPLRTCWDLARWHPLTEAMVFLDALLAKGVVHVEEIVDYACRRAGQRGWRKLLRAAQLASPGAQSPQESRLRVRIVEAGLPKPVAQYVVMQHGQFIARVDLAWPKLRIAIEYDGAWHSQSGQLEKDRARLNKLLGAGWIVIHVTAKRMQDDFPGIVRELRGAISSRAHSIRV